MSSVRYSFHRAEARMREALAIVMKLKALRRPLGKVSHTRPFTQAREPLR